MERCENLHLFFTSNLNLLNLKLEINSMIFCELIT